MLLTTSKPTNRHKPFYRPALLLDAQNKFAIKVINVKLLQLISSQNNDICTFI